MEPNRKHVTVLELSVTFEPIIDKAHHTKIDGYASLVADISNITLHGQVFL